MPFPNPGQTIGRVPYTDREAFLYGLATHSMVGEALFWYAKIDYHQKPTYEKAQAIKKVFTDIIDINITETARKDFLFTLTIWDSFRQGKLSLRPSERRALADSALDPLINSLVNGQLYLEAEIPRICFIQVTLPWKSSSIKTSSSEGQTKKLAQSLPILKAADIVI
ncbi:hypothetical protein QWY85_08305 [Neolewinella lacunae]|uniref:Uncharacterized protein n=1 Tax=Neolewinella lacunae TaxID=1517758 RepID=A0A923PM30_9BACT|nr:hypothetical protein [Neolewinella lacunae]MBC6994186.1 hypothetical protein [Neolewinella lacunae]MDN3634655.1 hypothetical protein [Neolewinella lacunae]